MLWLGHQHLRSQATFTESARTASFAITQVDAHTSKQFASDDTTKSASKSVSVLLQAPVPATPTRLLLSRTASCDQDNKPA